MKVRTVRLVPAPVSEPVLYFYGSPVLDVSDHAILFACGCWWASEFFGEQSMCERHRRERGR